MKISSTDRKTRLVSKSIGEPAWDVALLYPVQGQWSEEDYLALDKHGENYLIELADGVLEVLPMPDLYHQGLVQYLFRQLDDHVRQRRSGEVFLAPLPVRLWENQLREPDVIFLKPQRIKDRHKPPEGADLVVEVLSPGEKNWARDMTTKRKVYAKAKIPEYWIVDPEARNVTVLTLGAKTYKVHGKYGAAARAASKLLPGFTIDVDKLFAAGDGR